MATFRGQRYDMPVSADTRGNISARDSQYGATSIADSGFAKEFTLFAHKVDEKLGDIGQPIKPYLPTIGRILIVSTFLEDTLRLVTQWGEQTRFLKNYRGIPYILVVMYLLGNVLMMVAGSYLIIAKKYVLYGTAALFFVLISQGFVYGLIFDLQFFFRNLSLIGGLLLVVSDEFSQDRRRLGLPGLPQLDNKDRSRYLLLAGRLLVILLFIGHLARSSFSFVSVAVNLVSLVACVLVIIGFKARFSAAFLVVTLFTQNLVSNSYWRLDPSNPHRDFLRYEYFQTLSIVGGLILLVNMGAGRISIDEKKKIY